MEDKLIDENGKRLSRNQLARLHERAYENGDLILPGDQQRADLCLYMKSLHDHTANLPDEGEGNT